MSRKYNDTEIKAFMDDRRRYNPSRTLSLCPKSHYKNYKFDKPLLVTYKDPITSGGNITQLVQPIWSAEHGWDWEEHIDYAALAEEKQRKYDAHRASLAARYSRGV